MSEIQKSPEITNKTEQQSAVEQIVSEIIKIYAQHILNYIIHLIDQRDLTDTKRRVTTTEFDLIFNKLDFISDLHFQKRAEVTSQGSLLLTHFTKIVNQTSSELRSILMKSENWREELDCGSLESFLQSKRDEFFELIDISSTAAYRDNIRAHLENQGKL